jgi:hypothetical protein
MRVGEPPKFEFATWTDLLPTICLPQQKSNCSTISDNFIMQTTILVGSKKAPHTAAIQLTIPPLGSTSLGTPTKRECGLTTQLIS